MDHELDTTQHHAAFLAFLLLAFRLKDAQYRPEQAPWHSDQSEADYSWGLVLTVLIVAQQDQLDTATTLRAAEIALMYRLPRALLTNKKLRARGAKRLRVERKSLHRMGRQAPSAVSTLITERWREYHSAETPAVTLVKRCEQLIRDIALNTTDSNLAPFIRVAFLLKKTVRTGWNYEYEKAGIKHKRQVDNPESVAGHSWGLELSSLLIALLRSFDEAERLEVIEEGGTHDLAELKTEDIVTATMPEAERKKAKAAKFLLEVAAMAEICSHAPSDTARYISTCWHRYETGNSRVTRLVKSFDKLDFTIQGILYLSHGGKVTPETYLPNAVRELCDKTALEMPPVILQRIDATYARLNRSA